MRTIYLRLLLLLAAAVAVALVEGPIHRAYAEPTAGKLTVVVLVVDSLMPEELGQATPATPTLTAFRNAGTSYAESRSVFSAETVPNHVAMMTGVYPDRSGIPGNTYWNRTGAPEAADLSLPSELEASTLFTRIKAACPQMQTAAALSKSYLYEVFSECGYSGTDCGSNEAPDVSFDPAADPTFLEPSGHTPDVTTMREARAYLPDADFLFVNLGDVDRTGHVDVSGPLGTPAARYAALADTDTLVGQLISDLQAAGRWEHAVMIVLSDHGMDWSIALNEVNLTPELDPGLFALQSGGTGSIYVVDPLDPARDQKLANARAAALAHEGIEAAWYREPNPLDPGEDTLIPAGLRARHENFGDLVVMAAEGWRISEPSQTSNPLPGNHGHKATMHNTFIVGGGSPIVRAQVVGDPAGNADHFLRLPGQSENIDVAATVGWLLGLDVADMDGRALSEAFSWNASPSICGEIVDRDGDGVADYEDRCPLLAGSTDCVCPPAAADDCRTSARAKLSIRGGDASRLKLTLARGEASDAASFGNPATTDSVGLCIYGADDQQLAGLRMPAGESWRAAMSGAFRYKSDGAPDGVHSALLKPGVDGRTKIGVKASDPASLPAIPVLSLPLKVQVHSESGSCWGVSFDSASVKHNGDGRFQASVP